MSLYKTSTQLSMPTFVETSSVSSNATEIVDAFNKTIEVVSRDLNITKTMEDAATFKTGELKPVDTLGHVGIGVCAAAGKYILFIKNYKSTFASVQSCVM